MFDLTEIKRAVPVDRFAVTDSDGLADGEMAAVLRSAGTVQRASDATGVAVLGVAKVVRDGKAEIENGIFLMKNDTTNPVVQKTHIGGACYVKDEKTVDCNGGTYKVVAGLVVDVTGDGVYVDMRPEALAAANALVNAAKAAADLATHVAG